LVVQKIKSLFSNFYSLPVVFGRKMFLEIETRCFDDVFGGCSTGIRRLDKKIGCWKFLLLGKKSKIFRPPIFLPSLQIPAKQPPNTSTRPLVSIPENRSPPNIKGNESTF
jgi:hypothetical protein